MSALENVMVGCHTKSAAGFLAGMFNLPWTWQEEKNIRSNCMELLELRDALQALKGPMSNRPEFRKKIQEIIKDEAAREKLLKELNLDKEE